MFFVCIPLFVCFFVFFSAQRGFLVFHCLIFYFFFSVHSKDLKNQASREVKTDDYRAEDHGKSSRPLYALFVLPVLALSVGICVGYIRHFMLHRVRNLIRMVDNYMLSSDSEDMDQTPVKVLNIQDQLSTFDYESNDELVWDDSIERNAVVNQLEENKDGSNSSLIIDVNVEDYLKLFPKIPAQIHSTPKSNKITNMKRDSQMKSSSQSLSNTSPSGIDHDRFETSPHHFPSFNIPLSESSDESVDEDESKKIPSHNSQECDIEMKDPSTTRSGKRYK